MNLHYGGQDTKMGKESQYGERDGWKDIDKCFVNTSS